MKGPGSTENATEKENLFTRTEMTILGHGDKERKMASAHILSRNPA